MGRMLVPAVLGAALLAAACAGAEESAPAEESFRVEVGHNHVAPASVTVAVGDSVTFHNRDAMPGGHTIVADDGSFSSPPLAKDESWTHRFTAPGTVRFRIEQHPEAQGTIIVE